ncbi:hypothetical protein CLOP_g11974, partial [Closterium sp. NIES-67]
LRSQEFPYDPFHQLHHTPSSSLEDTAFGHLWSWPFVSHSRDSPAPLATRRARLYPMDVERKPWLPIHAVGRLLFNQPRRLAVVVLPDGSVSMYGPGKTVADVLAEHPPGHRVRSSDDHILASTKQLRPGSTYYLKLAAGSCRGANVVGSNPEEAEPAGDGSLDAACPDGNSPNAGKVRPQALVRRSVSCASSLSSAGGSGSSGSRTNSSSSCSSNSSAHSGAVVSDPWGRLDPRRRRGPVMPLGRRNSMVGSSGAAAAAAAGGGKGAGSNGTSGSRRSFSTASRRMSLSLDNLPELDAPALPHPLRAHVPRSQSMCDRRDDSSDDKSSAHYGGRGGSGGGVWERIRRRRASFSVGSPSGDSDSDKPHGAPWSSVAEEEEGEAPASGAAAAAGDDKGWLRDLVSAGRNWRGIRIGGGKDRIVESVAERGWLRGKLGRRVSLSLESLREMQGGEGGNGADGNDSSSAEGGEEESGAEGGKVGSGSQRDPWKADSAYSSEIPAHVTHASLTPHAFPQGRDVWNSAAGTADDGACAAPGSVASEAWRPVTPRTPLAPGGLSQHARASVDGLVAERNGAGPRGWGPTAGSSDGFRSTSIRAGSSNAHAAGGRGQVPRIGRGAAFPRNASMDCGRHVDEAVWDGLAHACLFGVGGRVAHLPAETSLEGGGGAGGATRLTFGENVGLQGGNGSAGRGQVGSLLAVQEGGWLGGGSGTAGEGAWEGRLMQQPQPQQQRHRRSSSFGPQERELLFSSPWDRPPPRTPPARMHPHEWGQGQQQQQQQAYRGSAVQHAPQVLTLHDATLYGETDTRGQLYQQFDRYMPYSKVQQRQQQQPPPYEGYTGPASQMCPPQMSPASHLQSEPPTVSGSHGVEPRYPDIMR